MSEPFIAEVRMVACNFAPRGWAFCDGQLQLISTNTALFSLIGVTYGGDGRSTFALPDLRERAPMHPGRGPGLTERRLGERPGSGSSVGAVTAIDVDRDLDNTAIPRTEQLRPVSSAYPPALAVNFCIALQGLYPSRS